jgi:sugar/nucleoside kinase (ribokinase family)
MIGALLPVEPVDYLIIGHISQDITPSGIRLGGTAAYAALTARSCGLRVGIVTSYAPDAEISALEGIPIVNNTAAQSTTFENISTPNGRQQRIHNLAERLGFEHIPPSWRSAPIVHLAPIAQEVDPTLVRHFPNALIGLTPQGWMRAWDQSGKIHFTEWPEASFVLERSSAAVLSIEDVNHSEKHIEEIASAVRILVVTEGAAGARLYWNGDIRYFRPPSVNEVDSTGAGDIFAASFFIRLYTTQNPWEAARFATLIAARSVTRPAIQGIPTPSEVQDDLVEIIPGN